MNWDIEEIQISDSVYYFKVKALCPDSAKLRIIPELRKYIANVKKANL